MSITKKRAIGDAVVSAGAFATLLALLVTFDDRVREQVMLRLNDDPASQVASAGAAVRSLTAVVMSVARTQSIDHAPLVIFVLIAAVLMMFMLRT